MTSDKWWHKWCSRCNSSNTWSRNFQMNLLNKNKKINLTLHNNFLLIQFTIPHLQNFNQKLDHLLWLRKQKLKNRRKFNALKIITPIRYTTIIHSVIIVQIRKHQAKNVWIVVTRYVQIVKIWNIQIFVAVKIGNFTNHTHIVFFVVKNTQAEKNVNNVLLMFVSNANL